MITYISDITLSEFIAAHYLHNRPSARPVFIVLGTILLALIGVCQVLMWVHPHEFKTRDIYFSVFIGVIILYYVVVLPYGARKTFKQNKFLHHKGEGQLDDDGFHGKSDLGESHIPWDHFVKWKENERLICLYITDTQFLIIPKRCLGAESNIAEARILIGSKISRKA